MSIRIKTAKARTKALAAIIEYLMFSGTLWGPISDENEEKQHP